MSISPGRDGLGLGAAGRSQRTVVPPRQDDGATPNAQNVLRGVFLYRHRLGGLRGFLRDGQPMAAHPTATRCFVQRSAFVFLT
jgi:hypothetical protein